MKTFRRLIPVGLMVVAFATVARGQVVVVSAKSTDGLISGLRSILAATDAGEPIQPALAFLDNLKAPGTLKGIDPAKPVGAYADFPAGREPSVVVLVPISDQADFLELLGRFGLQAKPVAGIPGATHSIELPGERPTTLLGRFDGGYACFTTDLKGPPAAPASNPAAVLAGRPGLLSATIRLDLIPVQMKGAVLGQIEATADRDRKQKPDEDDQTYQGRMAGMALVLDSFSSLLQEGRDLTLQVAEPKGDLAVELTAKALPGSKLAAAFQSFGAASSLFRGVGAKSIAEVYGRMAMSDGIRKTFSVVMKKSREDLAKKENEPAAKDLGNEMLDLFDAIFTAPAIDLGAALHGPFPRTGGGSTFAGVFAFQVEDGDRVDRFIRKLAKATDQERPDGVEKVTLDKDKASDGVTPIHEVRLTPGKETFAAFGDPVIRVATRRDAVVVAFGGEGLPALKQALDAIARPPAGPAPQIKVEASLGKLTLASTSTPKAAEELAKTFRTAGIFQGADADRDRVSVAIVVGDTMAIRFRMDGPTLKFLALMGQTQVPPR
jgi:hypothetical protein